MKKYGFIVVLVLVLLLGGCTGKNSSVTTDSKKFQQEYESLNGKKLDNGKTMLSLSIAKDNGAVYVKDEDIIELLKTGTGVFYFGFPECPWCRSALPVLLDAIKESDLEQFYYYNALSIRDTKHLEDGQIVTDQEGTDLYYEIVDVLKDSLTEYAGLEDPSIKRLYFPTVVFLKEGKVVDIHISTVDSQTDPYTALSEEEKEELKKIYQKGINRMSGLICTEDSNC